MSAARRARAAAVSAHKAAGTYTPRQPVRDDTVWFVARESRIARGRESLLEPSEPIDLLTSVRQPSAESHQFAPPQQATEPRRVGRRFLAIRKRRVSVAKLRAIAALHAFGLRSGATALDVRKEYRRRAVKAHPDQGGSTNAFIQLQRQYEVALTALSKFPNP